MQQSRIHGGIPVHAASEEPRAMNSPTTTAASAPSEPQSEARALTAPSDRDTMMAELSDILIWDARESLAEMQRRGLSWDTMTAVMAAAAVGRGELLKVQPSHAGDPPGAEHSLPRNITERHRMSMRALMQELTGGEPAPASLTEEAKAVDLLSAEAMAAAAKHAAPAIMERLDTWLRLGLGHSLPAETYKSLCVALHEYLVCGARPHALWEQVNNAAATLATTEYQIQAHHHANDETASGEVPLRNQRASLAFDLTKHDILLGHERCFEGLTYNTPIVNTPCSEDIDAIVQGVLELDRGMDTDKCGDRLTALSAKGSCALGMRCLVTGVVGMRVHLKTRADLDPYMGGLSTNARPKPVPCKPFDAVQAYTVAAASRSVDPSASPAESPVVEVEPEASKILRVRHFSRLFVHFIMAQLTAELQQVDSERLVQLVLLYRRQQEHPEIHSFCGHQVRHSAVFVLSFTAQLLTLAW